jgi:type III secretion protein V
MVKASVVNRLAVERQALSVEPADGIPGLAERDEQDWIWLAPDDPLLDDPQLERFTATSLILERMKQAMMLSGPQFLGIQESKAILGWLEHNQPEPCRNCSASCHCRVSPRCCNAWPVKACRCVRCG